MRKRIITPEPQKIEPAEQNWLDMEKIAEVEITSEDADYPIESALIPGSISGWRAAEPGQQTIRLLFNTPQQLRQIGLSFAEAHSERTQEYVLSWSADNGQSFHEIVRQQWNFSPRGATSDTEVHHVELQDVTVLELIIIPDISGGDTIASLEQLWLS